MIEFDKPTNLNGAELLSELQAVGIFAEKVIDFSNGKIALDVENVDLAKQVIAKHNGTIISPEPTIADKLASVGLTIDDLKSALGL
jgi:hypothetical protein